MTTSKSKLKKVSKFLSYVLRHCPEDIGLTLDKQGWASIAELVDKASSQIVLSYELIEEVVITNEKQRFKISEDKQKISANQGHSVQVDLKLESKKPPIELYHGTATRFLDSIKKEGLKRGQRHHVHLSTDISTTIAVGQRYGKPVTLKVDSDGMFKQGYIFFLTDNNVWLTKHVPTQYLSEV